MSDEIQTKKVNIELEVDTNTVDSSKNRFQGWIDMAKAVDAWRIFPRLFLTVYIILLYKCVIWYMNLGAPTMEQSGLISIVVGAGAAWFGLYTGTSKK
jgi:t-SNARE complex subunit (syntaxin)